MSKLKFIILFIALGLVAIGFQNCGKSLDLSSLEQQSSVPSVSIQAPSVFVQNEDYSMELVVRNISSYSVSWVKDSNAIEGETEDTLSFTPITPADQGTYIAVVSAPNGAVVVSDPVVVFVVDDPLYRVLDLTADPNATSVESGGQYFPIRKQEGEPLAVEVNTVLQFCRYLFGPASTVVTYSLATETTTLPLMAYAIDRTSCEATAPNYRGFIDLGPSGGLCLVGQDPGYTDMRVFTNITCRADPNLN